MPADRTPAHLIPVRARQRDASLEKIRTALATLGPDEAMAITAKELASLAGLSTRTLGRERYREEIESRLGRSLLRTPTASATQGRVRELERVIGRLEAALEKAESRREAAVRLIADKDERIAELQRVCTLLQLRAREEIAE